MGVRRVSIQDEANWTTVVAGGNAIDNTGFSKIVRLGIDGLVGGVLAIPVKPSGGTDNLTIEAYRSMTGEAAADFETVAYQTLTVSNAGAGTLVHRLWNLPLSQSSALPWGRYLKIVVKSAGATDTWTPEPGGIRFLGIRDWEDDSAPRAYGYS